MSKFRCPHCKSLATVRSSRDLSELTREQLCVCRNPECGHTFNVHATAVLTLSPSAIPDPRVALPMSSHINRALMGHLNATAAADHYQPVNVHTRAQTLDLFEQDTRPG